MKGLSSVCMALLITAPLLAVDRSAAPGATTSEEVVGLNQAVGTYFFESVTQSNGLAINGFITLHRDGTLTWADQSDFGAGGFFNSTTHGVWMRTGLDSIHIEGYYYRFDASGTPLLLVGFDVDGTLSTNSAYGSVNVYAPNQNPVLEPPLFPGVDAITITTYRLD